MYIFLLLYVSIFFLIFSTLYFFVPPKLMVTLCFCLLICWVQSCDNKNSSIDLLFKTKVDRTITVVNTQVLNLKNWDIFLLCLKQSWAIPLKDLHGTIRWRFHFVKHSCNFIQQSVEHVFAICCCLKGVWENHV